jgi:hypothetical protein
MTYEEHERSQIIDTVAIKLGIENLSTKSTERILEEIKNRCPDAFEAIIKIRELKKTTTPEMFNENNCFDPAISKYFESLIQTRADLNNVIEKCS